MNILESLFCYHYKETVAEHGRYAGQRGGIIVVMVTAVMLIFSALLLLLIVVPGFSEMSTHSLSRIFGFGSGKFVGKLLAGLLMLAIYPIVKYTIGRKESYDKMIDRFDLLPEEEQKAVAQKGVVVFLGSIGLFFLLFIIYAIIS